MSIDITQDVRYATLSDEGRQELKVYLDWTREHQLADSEYSFIYFAIGRAGLQDARHLLAVWQKACNGMNIDISTRQHTMRFFLNPTDASFALESASGWFDFLPHIYALATSVEPVEAPKPPSFVKLGDLAASSLIESKSPKSKRSSPSDQRTIVFNGWGVGVMHYTINRAQVEQVLRSYDQGAEVGALTYLFSQCPPDRPIRYFMGADEGLMISQLPLKDIDVDYASIDLGFDEQIDNSMTNINGAEFYCLLYSPDMKGEITLPEGRAFVSDKLKLTLSSYQTNENNYGIALEGALISAVSYDDIPMTIHCTPNDYSYYGQLMAYYAGEGVSANVQIFRSNVESGQWEFSRDVLVRFLSNKL
jgi:hypothetical protein